MRCTVLVIALAAACRSAPPPPVAAPASTPAVAGPIVSPEPSCVADCRLNHGSPADAEPIAGYCDELCTPALEPNPDCLSGCERSHEPGAYYDDDGEYQQHEDERTDDERTTDHEACVAECATVPTVSAGAIAACADDCVSAGTDEARCSSECDPDPYDECRYMPCD